MNAKYVGEVEAEAEVGQKIEGSRILFPKAFGDTLMSKRSRL